MNLKATLISNSGLENLRLFLVSPDHSESFYATFPSDGAMPSLDRGMFRGTSFQPISVEASLSSVYSTQSFLGISIPYLKMKERIVAKLSYSYEGIGTRVVSDEVRDSYLVVRRSSLLTVTSGMGDSVVAERHCT